jgi:2-methylcitrate dehydratase PrpD
MAKSVAKAQADGASRETAAQAFAAYASSLRYDDLPEHVVTLAKYCLIDALGCAIFGRRFPWSQIVLDEAVASSSVGPCRIPGLAITRLDASKAALVLGAMAHAFELDSICKPGAGVHPGATVALPAFAMAQAQGSSGRDLITAIVAGCEILFRIGAATKHSSEKLGFHAPGITGVFGSAAASAVLMKLPAEAIANAFGVAGSMAGGLLTFAKAGSGGMVKRLHLGRAAESGIVATRLASRGYEGPLSIFEGTYGVLEAYCDESDAALLTKDLGQKFEIERTCFKRYACHVTAHAPVQMLRGLIAQHGFAGSEIASIELSMSDKVISHHGVREPGDVMLAQYSVPFTLAIAAFHDVDDPRVFSGDVIKERRVRDLAKKIVLRPQPGLSKGWGGTMSIQLQNGKRLGGELNSFLGSPDTPFDADGLKVKFDKLVQDEAQGLKSSLFGELMRMELIGDVNDLTLA